MKSFSLKKWNGKKLNFLWSFVAILCMWLIWLIACAAVGNSYYLPSFSAVVQSFFEALGQALFWQAFGATLLRVALSFFISFALALACAVLSCVSRGVRAFLQPVVGFLRALPTLAVMLLLIFWFQPLNAPVIVTCLVLFPQLYAQFLAAYGQVDSDLNAMADAFHLSRRDRIFRITLPQAFPYVFIQLGSQLSFGIKIMVSAEVMANTYLSLGGLMQEASFYVEISRLSALTLVAVIFGLLIELLFALFNKHLFAWRKSYDNH
jgi:NitT/TauT family transport system permease protein